MQDRYPLDRGVNSLISSLREHGIEPNQNVYASLDGVWAELITRPIEAAHVLGKLLEYVGEDNVLWGTQSLLYGGPQPQIEAFRDFEIPVELQERHATLRSRPPAKTRSSDATLRVSPASPRSGRLRALGSCFTHGTGGNSRRRSRCAG